MKPRVQATLVATAAALFACKVYDPLYCDAENGCRDPERPFCDTKGEYPASEGVARTCIPDPFDAGADADAGSNGSSDADGGNAADAQPPSDGAAACVWTPLDRLSEVSTTDREGGPTLDFSGLNLYFFRQASAFGVYQASRPGVDQGFSKPSLVQDVQAYDPELSSSGLELFGSDGQSISVYERTSTTAPFGPRSSVGLSGTSPAISEDGLALYFVDYDGQSVQRATRSTTKSPWGDASPVLLLEGAHSVDVSGDELRLLITPTSPDPQPILVSERATVDDLFESPMPLNEQLYLDETVEEEYRSARWDGSETQMVVAVDGDLYYSTCR